MQYDEYCVIIFDFSFIHIPTIGFNKKTIYKCEFCLGEQEKYYLFLKTKFIVEHGGRRLMISFSKIKNAQFKFDVLKYNNDHDIKVDLMRTHLILHSQKTNLPGIGHPKDEEEKPSTY